MLKTAISNISKVSEGAWEAQLTPSEVSALGRPAAHEPGPSVLLAGNIMESADGSAILFAPADMKVLNRGTANTTFILAQPSGASLSTGEVKESGDRAFLKEASDAGLEVEQFARRMLQEVRKLDPDGALVSFPHRRFINKPDNFIVLVPQPQIRQLKVIVRGNPSEFRDAPDDLKPDQNGYSTFKIKSATGLTRAIPLLKQVRRKR